MIKIAPSILSADFSRLGEELGKIKNADLVHIDVMDGHFVPNISIGPMVIKSLRPLTDMEFDVHLMIENPDKYIDSFVDAGADIISVHVESCIHLNKTIHSIKQRGVRAAVALNPATPLTSLECILGDVDMVLLMTVNPGFGGQLFIKSMTKKIRELREIIKSKGLNIDIEVDGGIGIDNVIEVTKAGANVIVAGSAIFNSDDIDETIQKLRECAFKEL